jgi:excisionase family DNA binding protein
MKVSKRVEDPELLKSMKWLGLRDACFYMRRSVNTIKKLIFENKIYGTKIGGEWIIDRESIDRFYNVDRDVLRVKLSEGIF